MATVTFSLSTRVFFGCRPVSQVSHAADTARLFWSHLTETALCAMIGFVEREEGRAWNHKTAAIRKVAKKSTSFLCRAVQMKTCFSNFWQKWGYNSSWKLVGSECCPPILHTPFRLLMPITVERSLKRSISAPERSACANKDWRLPL